MPKPNGNPGNESDDKEVDESENPTDEENSEDNSEEDTSSESDDSEEDSEEENEEEDSEDSSDDEDEEDITDKYFADPSQFPKEVRGAFKRMQGIFTRKMQEMTAVTDKAEAFDELINDPRVRAIINGEPLPRDSEEDEDDDSEDKPVTKKDLERLLAQREEEARKKQIADYVKRERRVFEKNNPDHPLYISDMRKLMRKNPYLSFQDAYDLVKSRSKGRKAKITQEELDIRRRANSRKPSNTGTKKIDKNEKVDSVGGALAKAKRLLGWKGEVKGDY